MVEQSLKLVLKPFQAYSTIKNGMFDQLCATKGGFDQALGKNKPGTAQVGAYLRLKNSKRASKCQVFSSIVPE